MPTIEGTPEEIIHDKMLKAVAIRDSNVMVIETFIEIEGMTKGPVTIPVFNRLYHAMPSGEKNPSARITSMIGYAKDPKDFQIFQATATGRLDTKQIQGILSLERAFIADREVSPLSALSEDRLKLIHPTYIALDQLKIQQPLRQLFPDKELPHLQLTPFTCSEIVKLERILNSGTLKLEDKQKLLLRVYLRHLTQEDQLQLLSAVNQSNRILETLNQKDIGVMTGVFNPIHSGHVEAIKSAIREMALDQLILIPTPATTHNETPIEWEKRLEMAQLATWNFPEVKVISQDYKSTFEEGTGKVLESLFEQKPSAHWVHIMGSDSFKRLQQNGRLESTPLNPNYQILVIQRGGERVAPVTKSSVYYFESDHSQEIGQDERASSTIRKYKQEGKEISHLVPIQISKYIEKHNLY